MIKCTYCGSENTSVKDSRPRHGNIWRKRYCLDCETRWFTYEISAEEYKEFRTFKNTVPRQSGERSKEFESKLVAYNESGDDYRYVLTKADVEAIKRALDRDDLVEEIRFLLAQSK